MEMEFSIKGQDNPPYLFLGSSLYVQLSFVSFFVKYMAHRKVNSPEHLKNGEIFFWDTP